MRAASVRNDGAIDFPTPHLGFLINGFKVYDQEKRS